MNFSELITNCSNVKFSPNGQMVLQTCGSSIVVKESKTRLHVAAFSAVDVIDRVSWSPNSEQILVQQNKRSQVEVFSTIDPDFKIRIDEGVQGLKQAEWSKDGNQVQTVADFNLRITFWNLSTNEALFLKNPKLHDRGIAFNKQFMALLEKRENKNQLSLQHFPSLNLLVSHDLSDMEDPDGIHWVQENGLIFLWENPCHNKVAVLDPQQGLIHVFQPYQSALGLKSHSFKGRQMQGGFFDEKVRSFDCLSRVDMELLTAEELISNNVASSKDINVYVEQRITDNDFSTTKFGLENVPFRLSKAHGVNLAQNMANKYNHKGGEAPSHGISSVLANFNNSKLAVISESYPHAMFIQSLENMELETVLVMLEDIKSAAWNPVNDFCVFVTGNKRLQIQSSDEASVCDVPEFKTPLQAHRVSWNDDGDCLIVNDNLNCAIVYPQFEYFDNE